MILYYKSGDGSFQKIGEPVEISEISDPEINEDVPQINLTDNYEFSVEINMKRKDMRIWGEIFQMQRYKVTEWLFPKKKKRGTKRRARTYGKRKK